MAQRLNSYYLRRRADLENYLQARRLEAARVREENQARANLQGIRERLEARRSQHGG